MSDLSGMTGFGRSGGEADWGSWTWEAKAVNGRGLDVRVNVPSGFEGLDREVKKFASARFTRGNVQIGLRIEIETGGELAINQDMLDKLLNVFATANDGVPARDDALASLMRVTGVVEAGASSSQTLRTLGREERVRKLVLEGAATALEELATSRLEEGRALKTILNGVLEGMETRSQEAEQFAREHPALVKLRMEARLKELQAEDAVDAERLATEVAIQAAKADVREELDRLAAHIETGRGLLASGKPVGRKLDFLAQEMNREANTLCSKSASLGLTNAGLALKILIDQFKEQAANVE